MKKKKILIVEARFYEAIADMLADGAMTALDAAGLPYERVNVAGALEIPTAIRVASTAGQYAGYVALGCVIRGETSHYETVCNESARGLMTLGVRDGLIIGNGILTVENEAQALVRADKNRKDKGGGAAEAMLGLLSLQERWGLS